MESVTVEKICRDFMNSKCTRENCRFIHNTRYCKRYWKHGTCKFGINCKKEHLYTPVKEVYNKKNRTSTKRDNRKPGRNTESFEPMSRPVDMRIVYSLSPDQCQIEGGITSRDVLVAPNIQWGDDIYNRLLKEVDVYQNNYGGKLPLIKLWHGNDKIEGTHHIVNDHTGWKEHCPIFLEIINKIGDYFNMDIQATRLNIYKDSSEWKPFHHDAAYVDPKKAAVQNFTVAVSFGATRDAAFEHAKTKTVISLPQTDGCVYAFAKDTNIVWRHGILTSKQESHIGRISVIAWGFVKM